MRKGHNYGLCRKCGRDHGSHPRGMLGKKHTEESKQKNRESVKKAIAEGKIITKEALLKRSKALKGRKMTWGDKISKTRREKFLKGELTTWNKGLTVETDERVRRNIENMKKTYQHIAWKFTGKNNAAWRGGVSFLPYPPEFNNRLKEQIRKRDGYRCQKCGMTQEESLKKWGQKLAIHHIDFNKFNCDLENLVSFCHICNGEASYPKEVPVLKH